MKLERSKPRPCGKWTRHKNKTGPKLRLEPFPGIEGKRSRLKAVGKPKAGSIQGGEERTARRTMLTSVAVAGSGAW